MASGQATIRSRIVMRQPWSPPWRTTTIFGRSLPISRTKRKSIQVQSGFGVLFIPAFDTPGQAIDGAVLVCRAAGHAIDGRQWSNVGSNWVRRQSLVVPYAPDGPDDDVAGVRDAL
jgi:hypothetical protein